MAPVGSWSTAGFEGGDKDPPMQRSHCAASLNIFPSNTCWRYCATKGCTQARRDANGNRCGTFYSSRVNAVTTSNTNVNYKADDNAGIINIFAVPRGATVNIKDGAAIAIDGNPIELATVKPFAANAAARTDRSERPDGAVRSDR